MKKQFTLMAIFAAMLIFTFSSCESENDAEDTSNSSELVAINAQYVDKVVLPTYDSLANLSINLYDAIVALKANKTTDNVDKVADLWISTRAFWEESEAFLFGPVDAMGIDPHIDTWPMVESAFQTLINNSEIMGNIVSSNGDTYMPNAANIADGVLGFHSIEYIIFRNGAVRSASVITDDELTLAVAVAGDLRNHCCLIEVGWLGENGVSSDKLKFAKRIENYNTLITENGYLANPYATRMKSTPNSDFKSALASTVAVLDGAIDITNEVGTMKIGAPYNPQNDEDRDYIESKYSYNSKVDFAGNIKSVQNAYLGAVSSSSANSVSNYVKSINSSLDTEIKTAIATAIAKINLMENFETNPQATTSETAMNACIELRSLLEKAKSAIQNQ